MAAERSRRAADEIERFSLVRYFLVAGFVTAVLVAVVVSAFTAREVQADLQDKSEDYGVLIVRNLARQVHQRFMLPTIARDGYVDLERPEHLAALDETVRSAIAELDVKKVYFFDLEGRIIYSTTPAHRGFVVLDNINYQRAAAGEVSTLMVARGSPLDVDGSAGHEPLLETYVPIDRLDDDGRATGERIGVIEVYQDATELLDETRSASLRMAAIATLGIVTLMLALGVRIGTAQRTIHEKTRALVDVNARLAQLSADLEREVEDRTKRLVRAETLASVGTLAAGVAHEVNNPVASIASCAEGLLRRARDPQLLAQEGFAEFPEYLEIIRDEAFRVKEVTRGLLDFSRAGADGDGSATPVDLGSLLQATSRLLAWRCEREQKRVELDLPAAPVRISGDGAGLRQLLLNVTVNALDASPAGSAVRWTLRPSDDADGAELVCEDQGKGLSREDLARVLEPFFTRKPPGEGTGLGLSIAYGVARRHGGKLELTSEGEGRGARVTVRLAGIPGERSQA